MEILLKNVRIFEEGNPFDGQSKDILIQNGKYVRIEDHIEVSEGITVVEKKGLCISPGWVDAGTNVGEPGFEHRETLVTVTAAAGSGGYTSIISLPNTLPVRDTVTALKYERYATASEMVTFYPLGALSVKCKGEQIAEMFDMHKAGAVAFTDGEHSIQDTGLMKRALEYVKAFDGQIVNRPHDKSLAGKGQVNEGLRSVQLGVPGIPHIAEELMLRRDLFLCEYTQSRLHITGISTAAAVEQIRKAKAKGIKVTASVPAANLVFTDEKIEDFDSNFKLMPPLRTETDRLALIEGLKNGTVDAINTHHIGLENEAKCLEFPYADFGMLGLQTTYALLNTHLQDALGTEKIVDLLARGNRNVFDLPKGNIEEGAVADATLFDSETEWIFKAEDILSLSRNTPFVGTAFKGKVLGLINKGQYKLSV